MQDINHWEIFPVGNACGLVVRTARPASLAIWHRGRSHRRPNRSESPNRRHFASLDLQKHADFSHRRPTSQDFRRDVSAVFLVFQIKLMGFRIATTKACGDNGISDEYAVNSILLGNASLFTKCLFTIFAPLKPPPLPTSKMMDFLLNFY